MGRGGNQPVLALVMLIAASENNTRPQLSLVTVNEEARDALFVSPITGLLVAGSVPRYSRDAWFGKTSDTLPQTLIMHGTLDPSTAYDGATEHTATLGSFGPVTFHTVDRGAHLLPAVAPDCSVAAVGNFIDGDLVSERCAEPASEWEISPWQRLPHRAWAHRIVRRYSVPALALDHFRPEAGRALYRAKVSAVSARWMYRAVLSGCGARARSAT